MGNACTATSRADAAAPNDRPAAVKQAPKRYTSRKNSMAVDGTPNPLPPRKHSQRWRPTEEEEASERCVAALRDGETNVFGVRDASEPVTQSFLTRGDAESHIIRFTDDGSFADESPEATPLVGPPVASAERKHGCPKNLSEGMLSVEQQPGSISGWTGSHKMSDAASADFTPSPDRSLFAFSPVGPAHPGEPNFLDGASSSANNSPLLINGDDPLTPQAVAPTNAFDDSGTTSTSSYPSTMCSRSPFRPNERV